jgi:hypothetical protein
MARTNKPKIDPLTNEPFPLRSPTEDPVNTDFCYYEIHKQISGEQGQVPIQYHLKIPQLKNNQGAARRINQTISEVCQLLLVQMQRRMQRGDDDRRTGLGTAHFVYQAEYRITFHSSNYLCVLIEEYEDQGGAHGMPYREVMIFDNQTGQQLSARDLFALPYEQMQEEKEKAFVSLIAQDPKSYWENAIETLRERNDADERFYLKPDGVVFYYPPYELAPYAAGYVEVQVSYACLPLNHPTY